MLVTDRKWMKRGDDRTSASWEKDRQKQTDLQTTQTLVHCNQCNTLDLLFQLCTHILLCVSVHERCRNPVQSHWCCQVAAHSCRSCLIVWEQPYTSRTSILLMDVEPHTSELLSLQDSAMMETQWGQAEDLLKSDFSEWKHVLIVDQMHPAQSEHTNLKIYFKNIKWTKTAF